MKHAVTLALFTTLSLSVWAGPEEDRTAFVQFFEKRFPSIALEEHVNGAYALDEDKRKQWEALESGFPPYEDAVFDGEALWDESFANGASYSDCFGDSPAVKQHYPMWDAERGGVVTLELAINNCRESNGEKLLDYTDYAMVALSAYVAFESRDEPIAIEVPDQAALAAYEEGKAFYYQRRGQLNFACSSCHLEMAGNKLRSERLSAALGHVTHWPTYRSKWDEVGPLHKRFMECNDQVKAKAFELQSEEYRNLEYFLSYMSNGLPLNGPTTRK